MTGTPGNKYGHYCEGVGRKMEFINWFINRYFDKKQIMKIFKMASKLAENGQIIFFFESSILKISNTIFLMKKLQIAFIKQIFMQICNTKCLSFFVSC